ncbi:Argininosuccinate synthase [Fusarium oxysporum f. sp. cubense race 1]|uniref:argininosuccinate synthase n=1 Tax=Fusarium oxysporum f. sp. cubense (strain race 1) TaxID=1229664 RepID=N4URW8_FUSC1|nr:Argininosuccinate synthase [Fusarium oxysporum f. sp. cubense race 1]
MAPERVCLAYSGGLDTSTILKYCAPHVLLSDGLRREDYDVVKSSSSMWRRQSSWLVLQGYEVVCFLGDCGQEEDFDAVKAKALKLGAEKMIIENVQQELIDDLVWPAIQCNAIYEGQCTGKGNDQVRFELAWKACDPKMKVLAPWRIPAFFNRFQGRADLLKFAEEQKIPVSSTPKAPWSMDDNIIHCSYEAGILEQTDKEPPKDMWKRTVDPLDAPDKPTRFTVHFAEGVPVKLEVDGKTVTGSLEIFKEANELGRANGIGREDIVESRFIGLKSRGCYDTPGLTILRKLHQNLEGLVMDSKVRIIRDRLSDDWAQCIYNARSPFPSSPVGLDILNASSFSRALAYKGNVIIVGRSSETSNLYSEEESSMDTLDMDWSVEDTTGFINVNAIRIAKYGERKIRDGEPLSKRK